MCFRNETDGRYMQSFQDVILPEVTNGSLTTVWSICVRRVCHEAEFVRDAAIAITALRLSTNETSLISKEHYIQALQHYGRSIKTMKSDIHSERFSFRSAVVACFLMYCFEALHGDPTAAISHAQAGIDLLLLPDCRALVDHTLIPHPVEQEIFHAMGFVKGQLALTFDCSASPDELFAANLVARAPTESMPAVFNDIDIAEKHFFLVMGPAIRYTQGCVILCRDMDSLPNINRTPSMEFTWGYDAALKADRLPQELQNDHSWHLKMLCRWEQALRNSTVWSKFGTSNRIRIMQAHIGAMRLVLLSLVFKDECAFDRFIPQCEHIVDTLWTVFTDIKHDKKQTFTAESGFVWCIWVIIVACRDRRLRSKAYTMLQHHRQEGLWDTTRISKVADWIIQMEETAAGPSIFISESARIKLNGAHHMGIGSIVIDYRKRKPDHNNLYSDVISTDIPSASQSQNTWIDHSQESLATASSDTKTSTLIDIEQ